MITLLLQNPTWSSWITLGNALIGLVIFCGVVALAVLIVLSKKREEVHTTETKRADANEKLLKTRDNQLEDLEKRCSNCSEELEDTTTELRAVSSIKINELVEYWMEYTTHKAHVIQLEKELRILRKAQEISNPPNQ